MSRAKRIAFSIAAVLVAALAFEAGARVVVSVVGGRGRDVSHDPSPAPVLASELNDYQQAHPSIPWVWTLKPGFRLSLGEAIASKERSGRSLAARYFRERMRVLGLGLDDPFLRVNEAGFRGPELDADRSRVRVVTLGDSCTFGTFPEESTYPRVLEAELARRGATAEVVNAGVEGYSPRHVLARLEEYQALAPEVVTLYLGWNCLFSERPGQAAAEAVPRLATAQLVERAGRALLHRHEAQKAFLRTKRPDRADPLLDEIDDWTPSCFAEIEAIAAGMERAGSRVVLITLPGLFTSADPSTGALAIGHLPEFTDNPFVLAKMTERYNDALKDLARRRGYRLVDLAAFSDRELTPRDAWFFDSIHLHEKGQARIGAYLARELAPLVEEARSERVNE